MGRLARTAWRGSPYAAAALASAVGFLCVGIFGSLFDAPRLTTLFLLMLAGFGARRRARMDGGRSRRGYRRTER